MILWVYVLKPIINYDFFSNNCVYIIITVKLSTIIAVKHFHNDNNEQIKWSLFQDTQKQTNHNNQPQTNYYQVPSL